MSKTTEEKIAIMQASADGAEIEVDIRGSGDWEFMENPEFNWVALDYRIKTQRCLSHLPIDTLVCIASRRFYTCGQQQSTFASGMTSSSTGAHAQWNIDTKFKVLEQPTFTFWQGGECPLPKWVNYEVVMRDGQTSGVDIDELYWDHKNLDSDIIAYRILGEKDAAS